MALTFYVKSARKQIFPDNSRLAKYVRNMFLIFGKSQRISISTKFLNLLQ